MRATVRRATLVVAQRRHGAAALTTRATAAGALLFVVVAATIIVEARATVDPLAVTRAHELNVQILLKCMPRRSCPLDYLSSPSPRTQPSLSLVQISCRRAPSRVV